jgi:hypothetical protein
MPITITCADGANDFSCCDGSSNNDHDFSGLILDDGSIQQRFINPIQIARKASSVLVWDEHSNWRDVLVSDVAAASDVNELAALLVACRGVVSGFTREIFTNVTGSIVVTATIPSDTSKVMVIVGGIIAREGATLPDQHYTISGQTISFNENPESETVQVFIF